MKRSIVLLATEVLMFVGIVACVSADTPQLSDQGKLSISRAQVQVTTTQLQMDQLIQSWPQFQQYTRLAQEKERAQVRLQTAISKAFAEVHVSKDDYDLDNDLNLVAKSKAK